MATINDIGVPGQPMNNPPLTPWQAAVRDALNSRRRGVYQGTTDANGYAVIAHGLGTTPTVVLVSKATSNASPSGTHLADAQVSSLDATNFTLLFYRNDNHAAAPNWSVRIHWEVIA